MIGLPFNDGACLGAVTELIAGLVETRDEVLVQLAAQHPSTDALQGWLRGLPQRDDLGELDDGPKVDACSPPQRLRIAPSDPNCVERAALYLGVAELIDPHPVRQLATLDTPLGMHTFPVENGAPVILDPRVPRNCLDCGIALLAEGPVAIDPRMALEWTTQLAEAGARVVRNGPSRVRAARNAIYRLVDRGIPPLDEHEVDLIGWLLSLAERAARRYGPRALAIVRSTAQAISNLADEALARTSRNLSLQIAGHTIRPAPWTSALGRIAGRVGVQVGASMLGSKLAALGVGKDVISVLARELAAEGIDLGVQPAAPTSRVRNARRSPSLSAADVDLPSFALMVEAIASDIEPEPTPAGRARGRFGDRKVFIASIRRALQTTKYRRLSRAEMDDLLLRAHRDGLLQLARADLVAAMDPDEVRDSELRADRATFHFVINEPDMTRNASASPSGCAVRRGHAA